MQQALGLIETKGLITAIEAADAMLKAAKVKFLGRQKVKAGLPLTSSTSCLGLLCGSAVSGKLISPSLLIGRPSSKAT